MKNVKHKNLLFVLNQCSINITTHIILSYQLNHEEEEILFYQKHKT